MNSQELRLVNEAFGTLKEANRAFGVIRAREDRLIDRVGELEEKIASMEMQTKIAEIVEEMIERGALDPERRDDKVSELTKSGTSPEVLREALELSQSLYTLGRLEGEAEEIQKESGGDNPIMDAIKNFMNNRARPY